MIYTNFNEDSEKGLLPGVDLKDMLEEFSTMTDIGMNPSINSSSDAIIAMFQSLTRFFLKPITIDGSIMTVSNNRGITVINEGLQFIIKYSSTDITSIKLEDIEGIFTLDRHEELLENNFYNVRYEDGVFKPTYMPQLSNNLSLVDILTTIDNIATIKTELNDFVTNKTNSETYTTTTNTLKDDLIEILNNFLALYNGSDYTTLRKKYDDIETNNGEAVTENINKGKIIKEIGSTLENKDSVNDSINSALASLKTIHENEVLSVVGNIKPSLETWKTKISQMETLYQSILTLNPIVTDGIQRQLIDLTFTKAKQSYEKILGLYLEVIDLDTANTDDANISALETLSQSINNTKSELETIVLPDYLDKEFKDSTKLISTVVDDNATVLSDLQGRVNTIVSDHQRIRSNIGADDKKVLDDAVSKATQLQADIQSCMTTLSDNGITNTEFQKLKTISDNIGMLIDNTPLINDNHNTALENIDAANQVLSNLISAESRMDQLTSLVVNVQSKLNEANASKIEWQSYLNKCSAEKKMPTEIEYIRQKLYKDAPFVFNNVGEKETVSKVIIEHLIRLNNKKATLNIPSFKINQKDTQGYIWQNTLFYKNGFVLPGEGMQGPAITTDPLVLGSKSYILELNFVGSTGFVSGQMSSSGGTMYVKLSDEFISECHHRTPPTVKLMTESGNVLPIGFIVDFNVTNYDSLGYNESVPVDGYYVKTIPADTGTVDTIPGIDAEQTVTYLRTGFKDGDVIIIISNNGSDSTIVGCQSDFDVFKWLLSGGICKVVGNNDGTAITISSIDAEFAFKDLGTIHVNNIVPLNGAMYNYDGPKTRISGVIVIDGQKMVDIPMQGKMIIKAMSNGMVLTYDHQVFKIEIHSFHNNSTRYIVLGDNPNWGKITSFYLAQNETTLYYTNGDTFIYKIDGITAIDSFLSDKTYNLVKAPATTLVQDYVYVVYEENEIIPYHTSDTYSVGDMIIYDIVEIEKSDGNGGTTTIIRPDNVRRITPPPLPISLKIDAGVVGMLLIDDDYVLHTDYNVASILNVNYGELYDMGNVPAIYSNNSYFIYGDGSQCYKGHLFMYENHTEVHNLLLDKNIVYYENALDRVKSGTIV